jgi:hypothetical protein
MGLFDKTVLGEKLANLKRLQTAQLWIDSMDKDIQVLAVELNRMQLQQGFDSNNEQLKNIKTGKDKYALATKIIYSEIGRYIEAGGHYTMKYTSEFFNSIHVSEILNDGFEIDGNGQKKNANLFEIYGDEIIGLTYDSLDILREKLKIKMIEKCREYVTQA